VPEPEEIAAPADVEVSARPKELPAAVAELLEGRRQADEEKTEPIKPAPLPGAPRGTIRGRWGTRGRYRPAGAPPPIFEGQKGLRGEGLASDEPSLEVEAERGPDADVAPAVEVEAGSRPVESTESAGLIARLTRFPGVGGRTARTLVEAFGADVFRVLDEEPERVQELLPDHRAERVLQARREEREAGRA